MAILEADMHHADSDTSVVVETGGIQPMSVVLYHPSKQPKGNTYSLHYRKEENCHKA